MSAVTVLPFHLLNSALQFVALDSELGPLYVSMVQVTLSLRVCAVRSNHLQKKSVTWDRVHRAGFIPSGVRRYFNGCYLSV